MASTLTRVLAQVRAQDWWEYKIPPLLSAALGAVLIARPAPGRALATMGALMVSISFIAAYGHVINDIFDIEDDRLAGKPNSMAGKPAWFRMALLAGTAAGAFLPILLAAPQALLLMLAAADLLLPTLYSVPPVRLKVRGLWGALADTTAALAIPAASMIAGLARPAAPPGLLLAGAVGTAFFSGLRGIITHQVRDSEADAAAGAATFVLRVGVRCARALVMRVVFPCEVAFLALWLAVLVPVAPAVAVAATVWFAFECLKIRRRWKLPQFEAPEVSSERYIPLLNNEFYEMWLPMALSLQIATVHPLYAVLPLLAVFAFWGNLRCRVTALLPLFRRANESAGGPMPERYFVQDVGASPLKDDFSGYMNDLDRKGSRVP